MINPRQFWHLTDREDFDIDPEFRPMEAKGIGGPLSRPGLYVTDAPEVWAHHPYAEGRTWAAEVETDEDVKMQRPDSEAVLDPARARVTRRIPTSHAIAERTGYLEGKYVGDWRSPGKEKA